MTEERLTAIERRIIGAYDKDSFSESSEESKDIRMMEDMLNYIRILNIDPATYELYLQDVERTTQGKLNFADWALENNGNCGVY